MKLTICYYDLGGFLTIWFQESNSIAINCNCSLHHVNLLPRRK